MLDRKICVVGLGYMGMPLAIVLAVSGFDVIGCDLIRQDVDGLDTFKMNIYESG